MSLATMQAGDADYIKQGIQAAAEWANTRLPSGEIREENRRALGSLGLDGVRSETVNPQLITNRKIFPGGWS